MPSMLSRATPSNRGYIIQEDSITITVYHQIAVGYVTKIVIVMINVLLYCHINTFADT